MEILFFGSRGPLAKLLQKTLSRLGYYAGEIDGIFGEQTEEAVKQFQQDNQIPPTGSDTLITPYKRGTRYIKLQKKTI